MFSDLSPLDSWRMKTMTGNLPTTHRGGCGCEDNTGDGVLSHQSGAGKSPDSGELRENNAKRRENTCGKSTLIFLNQTQGDTV